MLIVGIDPGINGAMAVLNRAGELIRHHAVPKKSDGKVDIGCFSALMDGIAYTDTRVFLEDVHAIHGCSARSTFNFGWILGVTESLLEHYRLITTKVKPQAWQKVMFEGVPRLEKTDGKRDTKAMALFKARRLFPGEEFLRNTRCSIPHDGIVDACLIGTYGRSTLKGDNNEN